MRLFIVLICLICSCKNERSKTEVKIVPSEVQLVRSPSTQFPTISYDSVTLFSVNPKYYKSQDIAMLEQQVMTAPYTDGLAIIDSTGKPSSRYYSNYNLSDQEQTELREVFHLPPNNGEIEKMMCIPFYRDVFVFYRSEKQIAQAQICLQCRQVYLTPDTSYLAERFTTDADWNKIQNLIKRVKAN
jgi:hypothetical protein